MNRKTESRRVRSVMERVKGFFFTAQNFTLRGRDVRPLVRSAGPFVQTAV